MTTPFHIRRIATLILFGAFLIGSVSVAAPKLLTLSEPALGCETPIHWRLGDVDSRFPVDRKTFLRTAFEAEAVWEARLGRDLFVYDPQADFVVTTGFDERQKMTYDTRKLESGIDRYQKTADSLKDRYDALRADFDRDKADFERRARSFEQDLSDYNDDVAKANTSGGASPDEFASLEKRRKALEKEQASLDDASAALNKAAERLNRTASDLTAANADIRKDISDYRRTYGTPEPFIEGLYEPDARSITIFQFEGVGDLRLVLAHEFGHALGIAEHAESDPKAIMFPMMESQDAEHPSLTDADIALFADACPADVGTPGERVIRYLVSTPGTELSLPGFLATFSGR